MRAATRTKYGRPDVIEVRDVDRPTPTADGVLVRVRAASVNPVDWHELIGAPYLVRLDCGLRRPKTELLGADFAGTVEEVGEGVTRFQPGDEVFGVRGGAFAEYVLVPEDRAVVRKPANVSFEEAAAVGVAALTALQGLRDKGCLRPGQSVLVNGASGGVGTFAVQIAKALGAEVTGVCSPRNVELVRSLGADHVVDYTQEDFTRSDRRYDLLLDIAGNHSWSDYKRALNPEGALVMVGGPKTNRLIGPLADRLKVKLAARRDTRNAMLFLAKPKKEDLSTLAELLEAGKVKSTVDRRYELDQIADALRYLGEGHARARITVTV